MSYILDALERAQAEREHGAVPGLHSPTVGARAPRRTGALPVAMGVLALALGALAAWWWLQPDAQPASQPAPQPAPYRSQPTAPAPAPATLTAPPPPMPQAVLVPPTSPARNAPSAAAAAGAPPEAAAPRQPRTSAPAAAADDTPVALESLPAELRAQIPALRITGAVQAQDPRNSLLLVNGQVVSPGAELAPGLVLERVDAHRAVLRFAGTRFRVAF